MVYGFLGQGLLQQGHTSKGLMAEAGVSLEVRGSCKTWLDHGQHLNSSTNTSLSLLLRHKFLTEYGYR